MEVIEILGKTINSDNKYNLKLKNEFVLTINRISNFKTISQQLHRQMAFHALFNAFVEEINFLLKQKKYFKSNLDKYIGKIMDDYLDSNINIYNHYLNKL